MKGSGKWEKADKGIAIVLESCTNSHCLNLTFAWFIV